ncbi:glycoside hydrolase family 1 protein [Corynebacterium sp. HMSC077G01]|uniref:glycoside hydrolase family 1 protein n=1 Tax=Corynebacterium sp. HMSC077G01 TaxID=1715193 RepID=UPI0008A545F6|nr:family 1 glycosylhydrolase [Corynebacterium sp. HMSC077G01]OFM18288.1 beta-glucosidase [Corynebacterium sp. HMSC077G01]
MSTNVPANDRTLHPQPRTSPLAKPLHHDVDLRGLLIGTASAAGQIEGGDENNDWFDWAREPGNIADGSTPLRATDHWNRWREDNELMASLGLPIARIGVEWARIEPRPGEFDHAVLDRYREEIADLRDKGIRPLVTLHHFVNPLWFARRGGFTSDESPAAFLRYAETTVRALDDLVDEWITVNEPNVYATQAHMFRSGPPGNRSWGDTMAVLRNMAVSHIRGYEVIRGIQGDRAKVGIAHHARAFAPRNPHNPIHRGLARINRHLFQDIVADAHLAGKFHPLLGGAKVGRGLPSGRHHDFLGLNYYSRTAVDKFDDGTFVGAPVNDLGWEIHPEGLVECARDLNERFGGPVWITENGTCDLGDLELSVGGVDAGVEKPNPAGDYANPDAGAADRRLESFRPRFILEHLRAIAESDVPIERWYHWCFVDNWEWADGEEPRFGIVHLDYETQERTMKPSGHLLAELARTGRITPELHRRYTAGRRYPVADEHTDPNVRAQPPEPDGVQG